MMKEIQKPNDILIATLSTPQATAMDLLRNDINIDNTSLLSREEYKNTPFVKKQFTQNGVFNEDAFNKAYDLASEKYWELEDDKLYKNLEQYLEYSDSSRYRPLNSNKRDTAYTPEVVKNNPLQQQISAEGFNIKSNPVITPEEAAQQGRIWDPENKKWVEGSAESRSLGSKFFGQTLVYAQYEQDGWQANPITGEMGNHKKGEFITDENGQYFTELLGSRDLLDKQVVSVADILTKEKSALNKVDFFDSDGYDKSLVGVAMKLTASVLPYMIPGFNTYYGMFRAATGLASTLPTVYKSLEGLVMGDEETALTDSVSSLENWFRKFDPSMSRKGKSKFFSVESIGNLLADTFGQLYQQRGAAKLAEYIKKVPKLNAAGTNGKEIAQAWEERSKLAKALSLGYMSLVSAADVYNDALKGGYDKRTAGLSALMSAGALYGVMNLNATNSLGTWFLDKTVGYNPEVTKAPIIKQAKSLYKEMEEAVQKALVDKNNKQPIVNVLSKFKTQTVNFFDDVFRTGGEGIWQNMVTEGIEEVSEEVVQDAIKGIVDTLSWLGYTGKEGSFGGWQNVFSKEGAARYFQTFAGGALGGGLFHLQEHKIEPWIQKTFVNPNYVSPHDIDADKDVLDVILSGRTKELIEELERCRNIFSDKRAATGLVDKEGKAVSLLAEGQTTQADAIVNAAIERVQLLDSFVNSYIRGIDFDLNRFDDETRKYFRKSFKEDFEGMEIENYVREKFKNSLEELHSIHTSLTATEKTQTDEKKKSDSKKSNTPEQEAEKADKANKEDNKKTLEDKNATQQAFNEKLAQVRGFFSGEEWLQTAQEVFELEQILKGTHRLEPIKGLSFDHFYKTVIQSPTFTTPYDQLEKESTNPYKITKKKVDKLYKLYKKEKWQPKHFQELIPMLVKIKNNMHKLVDPDAKNFIQHQHKAELIKSIKSGDISYEMYKKWVEEMDDGELFDNETLAEFTKYSEEQQNEYRKLAREQRLEWFLNQSNIVIKPENIADFIRLHPKAWSMSDRRNIDYASKLIETGAIVVDGFNEEQLPVLKELINIQAAATRIDFFNKEILEKLIRSVNRVLSTDGNIYYKRMEGLSGDSDSSVESPLGLIQIGDLSKIAEVRFFKLESMMDYLADDAYIEEQQYNDIVTLMGTRLTVILQQLQNVVEQTPWAGQKFAPLQAHINKKNWDKVKQHLSTRLNAFCENGITKESLEALKHVVPTIVLQVEEHPEHGYRVANSSDIINVLGQYIDQLQSFQTKFDNSKIITNPLVTAVHKILDIQDKSGKAKNAAEWAIKKALDIIEKKADVDLVEFDKDDQQSIEDALGALSYLHYLVEDSRAYGLDEVGYGSNQLVVNHLKTWGKSQESIDRFLLLDGEDVDYFKMVISEAASKLQNILQIQGELSSDKTQEYQVLFRKSVEAQAHFFKSKPLLDLRVLSLDDNEVQIVSEQDKDFDIENASDRDLLAFVLRCKQNIAIILKKQQEKNNWTQDQLLQHIWDDIVPPGTDWNSPEGLELQKELFRSSERADQAIEVAQNGDINLGKQWLLWQLVSLSVLDQQTITDVISKAYDARPEVFPRIDQIEAMERLLAWGKDPTAFSTIQSKLADAYTECRETSENAEDFAWDKIILNNTAFLLGSGGAGKNLIVELLSDFLKKQYKHAHVTALSPIKTADLKEQFKGYEAKTLHEYIPGLKEASALYKEAESQFVAKLFAYKNTQDVEEKKRIVDEGYQFEQIDDILVCKKVIEVNNKPWITLSTRFKISSDTLGKIDIEFNENNFDLQFTGIDKGSLLIIDECTLLDNFTQQLLSKLVKEANPTGKKEDSIAILQIGDPYQQSDTISYEHGKNQDGTPIVRNVSLGLAMYMGYYLPMLKGSWRAHNNLVRNNSSGYRKVVEQTDKKGTDVDFSGNAWNNDRKAIYNNTIKDGNFKFQYSTDSLDDNWKFMGTLLSRNEAESKRIIDLIQKAKPGRTIAVIYDNSDDKNQVKNELAKLGLTDDKVTFVKMKDVQGAEFDYTIAYKLKAAAPEAKTAANGNLVIDNTTTVYTEITRGKQGNLVIPHSQTDYDLFYSVGLTVEMQEDRGRQASLTESSAVTDNPYREYYKHALSTLPAISKQKELSSVQDRTKKTTDTEQETAETKHDMSKSLPQELTTSEEEDLEEPEQQPVVQTDKDGKVIQKEHDKVSQRYTENGFDDFTIGQGYYYHGGVTEQRIEQIRNSIEYQDSEQINDIITLPELEQFRHLMNMSDEEFGQILASNPEKGIFHTAITELGWQGRRARITAFGGDLIAAFCVFVRTIKRLSEERSEDLFYAVSTYDASIDFPIDKLNDDRSKKKDGSTFVRHVFPIFISTQNIEQNFIGITISAQGWSKWVDTAGKVHSSSKTVDQFFTPESKPDVEVNGVKYYQFTSQADSGSGNWDAVMGKSKYNKTQSRSKSAMRRSTSARNHRLNHKLYNQNAKVIQNLGGGDKDLQQLKFGRMFLHRWLKRGWVIEKGESYQWDPSKYKHATEEERKAAFIKWYSQFRFDNISIEGAKRLEDFSNHRWIVLKELGSNLLQPVKIAKITTLDSSLKGNFAYSVSKSGVQTLNVAMHRKIASGLAYLVKKNHDLTDKYRAFQQAKKGDELNNAKAALFKALDDIQLDLVQKYHTQSGPIKSFIISFKHLIEFVYQSELVGEGKLANSVFEEHWDNVFKSGNADLVALTKFLDSDKQLAGFFYETDITTSLNDSEDFIMEIIYESSNTLVDNQRLKRWSTAGKIEDVQQIDTDPEQPTSDDVDRQKSDGYIYSNEDSLKDGFTQWIKDKSIDTLFFSPEERYRAAMAAYEVSNLMLSDPSDQMMLQIALGVIQQGFSDTGDYTPGREFHNFILENLSSINPQVITDLLGNIGQYMLEHTNECKLNN